MIYIPEVKNKFVEERKRYRNKQRSLLRRFPKPIEPVKPVKPVNSVVRDAYGNVAKWGWDYKLFRAALRGEDIPPVPGPPGSPPVIKPKMVKIVKRGVLKPRKKVDVWSTDPVNKKKLVRLTGIAKGKGIKLRGRTIMWNGKRRRLTVVRIKSKILRVKKNIGIGVKKVRFGEIWKRRAARRVLERIYNKVKASPKLRLKVAMNKPNRGVEKRVSTVKNRSFGRLNISKLKFKGEERDRLRGLWGIIGGMLMRDGKKQLIENAVRKVRVKLRKKMGNKFNLDSFVERAVRNVTVRIGIGKRRVGGRYRWIPISMVRYKAIRQGCKRIKKGVESRKERTVEERLMNELIDAYNNVGRSVKLVIERRKLIKESKSWLKLIR